MRVNNVDDLREASRQHDFIEFQCGLGVVACLRPGRRPLDICIVSMDICIASMGICIVSMDICIVSMDIFIASMGICIADQSTQRVTSRSTACQSKAGPGSVLRPAATSRWPTMASAARRG